MNTVLIVYPHWPPSNLVGVHRVRLVANNLAQHGWHAIVLTVSEEFYEEPGAAGSDQLVKDTVEVIKVSARAPWTLLGKRIIGDIGLRAFGTLKQKALELCRERPIDFVWISMPSWYPALMGKSILSETGVPFGIDYQDPWVQALPPGTSPISRAGLTQKAAQILEPIALRHAALITGINRSYFQGALDRNPRLNPHSVEFQLGFDPADHSINYPANAPWPKDKLVALYPGAFLPLSAPFHLAILSGIKALESRGELPANACFVYLGTGHSSLPILSLARDLGIAHRVYEFPNRIPYLEVLQLLRNVHGCMIIGSPEPHYSASKVFQSILSGRPIFSLLHRDSEAMQILKACSSDAFSVGFEPNRNIQEELETALKCFWNAEEWSPNLEAMEQHSASRSAATLANAFKHCLDS